MQSVKRALLYPFIGWGIWMGTIMTAYGLLPETVRDSSFFVSLGAAFSSAVIVGMTVLYLRKVGQSSAREGFLVGMTALGVIVALDVVHNLMLSVDMGAYFLRNIPHLVLIPLITTLVLGMLRKK